MESRMYFFCAKCASWTTLVDQDVSKRRTSCAVILGLHYMGNTSNKIIIPIENLSFSKDVKNDLCISRVRFIGINKFLKRPGLYGFPKKVFNDKIKSVKNIWENVGSIALIYADGSSNRREIIKVVNQELEMLVGSIVAWKRRPNPVFPRIQGLNNNRQINMFYSNGKSIQSEFNRTLMYSNLVLSSFWVKFVYNSYFVNFISNYQKYDPKWRNVLKRVFQLLGKSQMSIYLTEAFLYNMIALETLLLTQQDKFMDAIPKHLYA